MADEAQLAILRAAFPGAKPLTEGGKEFIYFPELSITVGGVTHTLQALLSPSEHSGYPTRLFLSKQIPIALNWNHSMTMLDRTWYTWSWSGVSSSLPLLEIFLAHLAALR